MLESFPANILTATESYWTESHIQLCQTSTTELLYESVEIGLMVVILMVTCGELVLWGVDAILGNGQKQPLEVFYRKGVLRNLTKFTLKHLCTEKYFHVDFAKFLRKRFLQNISRRLLLSGYGI